MKYLFILFIAFSLYSCEYIKKLCGYKNCGSYCERLATLDTLGNYHFIANELGTFYPTIDFERCVIKRKKKVRINGKVYNYGAKNPTVSGMKVVYAIERNKTLIVQKTVAVANAQGRFKVTIPYSPDAWLILVNDSTRNTCYQVDKIN